MRLHRAFWMLLLCGIALLRVHPADDKKLAIYAPEATYSLPVTEHDKQDYVPLFALVEPLAKTSMRIDGKSYRLQVNESEGEFKEGKSSARVGKNKFEMSGKLVVENGQALVPTASVMRILSEFLKRQMEFHETGRRLFFDKQAIQVSSALKKGEPSSLVISFSAPVNPTVHTEAGKVRLTFNREPVVGGLGTAALNDKLLTSSTFSEANGAAELTVAGTGALMATFSDGGKTITVSAAPGAVAAHNPSPSLPAASGAIAAADAVQAQPAKPPSLNSVLPLPPKFFVMIDPGHGGDDPGAKFSETLLEKDITLAIARKLRSELQSRGINAVLLRDSDTTLSFDQRAIHTNAQRASIYVSLHVASPGSGVRVYSALLPAAAEKETSSFVAWERAQSAYLGKSRELAGAVAQEFGEKKVHALMASSPLRPLNSIACAAIGIEIAERDPQALSTAKLQQSMAMELAAAIVNGKANVEKAE